MIACVVLVLFWMTGCTLATNSSGSSSPQPSLRSSITPNTTLTVFTQKPETPTATRRASARIAMQPSPPASPPRIYIVKENDTLLDIAIRFDIELEALLLANPAIDPLTLQIGQELIIPEGDTLPAAVTDPAAPSLAPPPPLPLMPPDCYPTSTDGVICTGFVANDQLQPVEQVSVDVQITNTEQLSLGEQMVMLEQAYIPPGGIAPYRVIFPGVDNDRVDGVTVTLVSAALTEPPQDNRFALLQIQNDTLTPDGRRYVFEAELVNVGERTAQPPRVVVTLVDDQNRVYGYRIWEGSAPLFPEVRTRVRLSVLPIQPQQPVNLSYRVHAEALAVE